MCYALDTEAQGEGRPRAYERADYNRRTKGKYELSDEEFAAWMRDYSVLGQDGPRVKKLRTSRTRENGSPARMDTAVGTCRSPASLLPISNELNDDLWATVIDRSDYLFTLAVKRARSARRSDGGDPDRQRHS